MFQWQNFLKCKSISSQNFYFVKCILIAIYRLVDLRLDAPKDNDDINMIVAIPSDQRLTYEQQNMIVGIRSNQKLTYEEQVSKLTEPRLKKAGFVWGEETMGDGNCFLWALLDQMR